MSATREIERLRRKRPWAIVHSGGARTIYGCLCGKVHTVSTRNRAKAHVGVWMARHNHCPPPSAYDCYVMSPTGYNCGGNTPAICHPVGVRWVDGKVK